VFVTGREWDIVNSRLLDMRRILTCAALAGAMMVSAFGAEARELKDEAGKTIIRYVAETPEGLAKAGTTDPSKQVGVFLCFPEHDRPTGDEILPVREALKRQGLLDQYILIAGHPQGQKFGAADYEPIKKLLAWALKTYPINPRRVYMYGKGEGGKISGEMTMAHPELFAAAISYSWTWWKMPAEVKEAADPDKMPRHYIVLGRRDLSHHLTNVRDGYSRVLAKGYPVIYREFDELGARTYHPPSNDEAIAWAARLRNRTLPLTAAEKAALARPAVVRDGILREAAIVGGDEAGVVVRKALESADAGMRAAAARTCGEANLGETTMEALAKKMTDSSAVVRREAIRALAVNANWRSAAAQRALIGLALGAIPAVDPADRVDAVDGIVYAARFQVKGVRQDPGLFRALVTLLDDKQEELRTMASNVLMPIRDPEFRGDIGRPEKKAPEGGWAAWLEAVEEKNQQYEHGYKICATATEKAAELYCQGGALLLGRNLKTGAPVKKQPDQGLALTVQAAEMGFVPAQAQAGMMYAVAKGTEQNLAEAAKWLIKAADGGHKLAAVNASMVYRMGMGRQADPAKGTALNKLAAEYVKTHEGW